MKSSSDLRGVLNGRHDALHSFFEKLCRGEEITEVGVLGAGVGVKI